ncbi:Granule-associated protein [Burkholderiales bacterium]|nr:Granule-associated protein [Burkholderiales bacterium]
MNSTSVQLAELQRSHLDALSAFGSALCDATEKLATLNFAATRAVLQETAQASQNLLGSRDAQGVLAIAGGLVQPATEKLMRYSRNAYGIASGTNAELSRIVEAQVAEGNRRIVEFVEIAFKNAPAGSEAAVSFLKSAFTASNTACENISNATRQALELAEANLEVAATEVVKSKARKTS